MMKTIKECYKTEEWEYQKALEDVIKLIDELKSSYQGDEWINVVDFKELKARIEG